MAIFPIVHATAQDRCGTDAVESHMHALHPAAAAQQAAMERDYQRFLGQNEARGGVRTIPVVVHVIQASSGIAISDARILEQIEVLNEDFLRYNADTTNTPAAFQGIAANTQIEFCLATIDPNGCPTDGINRIVSPGLADHDQDDAVQLKGLIQWDPYRYLNIWVPVTIQDQLLGYATPPNFLNFSPTQDGVVVNGRNFGRNNGTPVGSYNLGRTLTHEVGHWLGLSHTFSGGCAGMTPSNCANQGDRVCDTPPTSSANYGCPGTQNTCNEQAPDMDDQTMNFMDYTDDACMNMYTTGQGDRMFFFLNNIRAQVWSPANLTATGCDGTVSPGCSPTANFLADIRNGCVGENINFSDISIGPATSWSWTFSGGTPATSTVQNPTVYYATPGFYSVTLEVTNNLGQDTKVESSYIVISDVNAPPIVESFEGILNLPAEWYTDDEDQLGTWELYTTAASDGQNSMVMRNWDLAGGSGDALVSEVIDLLGIAEPKLTFDHAYKRRDAFNTDTLRVEVSIDCGATWTTVWDKGGPFLATVGGLALAAPYEPLAAHWVTDTINLSAFVGSRNTRIRFLNIGGDGQNIYLDNINLDVIVGREKALADHWSLDIVPNPFRTAPEIMLNTETAGQIAFRVLDLRGKVLFEAASTKIHSGRNSVDIPSGFWDQLSKGMYFLEGYDGKQRISRKLIKN